MAEPAKSPILLELAKARKPPSRLRRIVSRNLGLRALALLMAIALWVFVNGGEHSEEVPLSIPVRYSSLPVGMMIINQHPQFVKVTVAGPPTLLSLVNPDDLTLKLNLTGVSPGEASFRLSPEMFNNVKRGTSITRIVPSQIVLDIDRIVTQQLPVQLHLDGKPAAGYKVVSTEVRPAQIAATGPSRFFTNQKHLNTEPLGIQDAASDVDAPVRILGPGPHVRLTDDVVEAKVILQPIVTQREFRGVKVLVRDAISRSRIEPAEANLIVRGPAPKLSKLDLSDSVFVEAGGLSPGGWHVKPIQVTLPDGMQLVRQEPQKVRLRIYR
ncbi:MAG: hypothetical protein IVW54_13835 [Candidatus Binataceae bacterium]|nr:hypothetical protein [Candidatus Binataceae bacterium]